LSVVTGPAIREDLPLDGLLIRLDGGDLAAKEQLLFRRVAETATRTAR
jgi:hypothetical protein